MRTVLPGIPHRDEYTRWIEREANSWANEALIRPVEDFLSGERLNEKERTTEFIAAALISGTLWYHAGIFGGEFNSKISRELRELGATLRGDGTFYLPNYHMPIALRSAIAFAAQCAQELHRDTVGFIDTIQVHVKRAILGISVAAIFNRIISDLSDKAKESVPIITESEQAEFDERMRKIAEDYLGDIKKKIEANVRVGARPDKLRDIVAAWETALRSRIATEAEHQAAVIVTKFRRELARKIGSHEYVWQDMGDNKVRRCHRLLNGKTFNWDNPPVVDDRTGFRGHPGDAANCRCVPCLILTHAAAA